jgi:dipeptidase E
MGHIVAMGGGGFSMEDDRLLDDYVLALVDRDRPRVGFLATASGDADNYIEKFHTLLGDRAETSALRLFSAPSEDPATWFANQDVVYVGGGSTANLLAVWRVHGIDALAGQFHDGGGILCGVSAGAICWFQGGTTDSFGPIRPLQDGLAILEGSFTPHYDGEADRRPLLHRALVEGALPAGLAADDFAAAHFIDGAYHAAVASRPTARVYTLHTEDGRVIETPLDTSFLGG